MEQNKQNVEAQNAIEKMVAYLQENTKDVTATLSGKGGYVKFEMVDGKMYVCHAKNL